MNTIKNSFIAIGSMILFTILSTACTETNKKNTVSEEDNEEQIEETEEKEEKEESSNTDYFKLNSISGFFVPRGAFYDFDTKKKKWCERPKPSDIQAYMFQNNLDDPNKVPDMSFYFDKKANNQLNSCFIFVETKGDKRTVSLRFGGNLIYEESIDPETKIINISKPLKYFNIVDNAGSMILTGGRAFKIEIDSIPMLKFENELGDYELSFVKMNMLKTGKRIALVNSEKSYFYSMPDENKKDKSYVVKNQNIFFDKEDGEFVHALFTNNLGIETEGWIIKSDLRILN